MGPICPGQLQQFYFLRKPVAKCFLSLSVEQVEPCGNGVDDNTETELYS